jgi:hypothetical protein
MIDAIVPSSMICAERTVSRRVVKSLVRRSEGKKGGVDGKDESGVHRPGWLRGRS